MESIHELIREEIQLLFEDKSTLEDLEKEIEKEPDTSLEVQYSN